MTKASWLDARQERAWRALQFMQMRLTAHLARDLAAESGLAYQDYVVLVALTDEPEGRLRLFELAEKIGWERSRLSHHVSRMADRGLVTKEKCTSDGRGSFVAVTPLGKKEIEAAAPGHAESVRRLFIDSLTPEQLDAMGDAAQIVLERLSQFDPLPPEQRDDKGSAN